MEGSAGGRYHSTSPQTLNRALQTHAERISLKNLSISDPKAWDPTLWNLIGTQSLSGETVTEETALTFSAVFCAISIYSGTIGALPLQLLQQKDNKKTPASNKPLYWVLHSKANPYLTAMNLREAMTAHIVSWGNGYAEIVRNPLGEIVELWPIPPNRVRQEWKDMRMIYWIRVDGGQEIPLSRSQVLHIPGLGFDGFKGYSVISLARKSIGLGMAMESFGSLYFGSGTHPDLVVSHPGSLSDKARDNIKASITAANSGLSKAHRIMLLEEGMKVEKVNIPPNDSQFLESRTFQVPEIARWFNLPPHKLKDMGRATWGNIESEQISFVTDSLLPWLVRIEQNYNMQLLTDEERLRDNFYFKHNVNGLLRGDSNNRGNFYTKLFNIGAMSPNEIRDKEDMDPVPGGDQRFVPLNMIPLSMAEELNSGNPEDLPPETKARILIAALFPGNGHGKKPALGKPVLQKINPPGLTEG